jgi:hypothetical protein
MASDLVDRNAPRYHGPLPKPRGLLSVPPEVAEEVARDQGMHQPYYTDDYAKLIRDNRTLAYYYEGEMIAYGSTPQGIEVLAVGPEEVEALLQGLSQEGLLRITIGRP